MSKHKPILFTHNSELIHNPESIYNHELKHKSESIHDLISTQYPKYYYPGKKTIPTQITYKTKCNMGVYSQYNIINTPLPPSLKATNLSCPIY